MTILAIETSCDETSLALVKAKGGLRNPQYTVIKVLTDSQIETHRPYGGVVPNLAKNEHLKNLPILFKKIVRTSNIPTIDMIAVTVGPGLEPCLWTGINFAQEIKKTHFPKAKIVETNHLHGHMLSFLLDPKTSGVKNQISKIFPTIQLLVSGKNTILILMKSLTDYEVLGQTRDDAAGEAFDKVARMLKLPYPGGPEIERIVKNFRSPTSEINFPRPMLHSKDYDFSFSGLKTAVLYYLKKKSRITQKTKQEVASSFQQAVVDVLTAKTIRAAQEYEAKSVILSGGVAANSALRTTLQKETKKIGATFITAPKKYQGDNAAMIAAAGYVTFLRERSDWSEKSTPRRRRGQTHLKKKKYPLKANGKLGV